MDPLEQAALSGALTTVRLDDSPDPDGREPDRSEDDSSSKLLLSYDDEEEETGEAERYLNAHLTSTTTSQVMSRGWSGNTGPKGVLLDFKASHGKSGAILGGDDLSGRLRSSSATRRSAMTSSGFNNSAGLGNPKKSSRRSTPTSESDSDSDHHHRATSTRLSTRLIVSPHSRRHHGYSSSSPPGLTSTNALIGSGNVGKPFKFDSRNRKLFGHLREVGVENFIQAVEAEREDRETVVLVHLYDPALESCVILNSHLSNLARLYPRTKFLRALASELDFFNMSPMSESSTFALPTISPSPRQSSDSRSELVDPFEEADRGVGGEERRARRATDSDVLPTLIWYRAGEYVQSLPALERELPTGLVDRGERSCKELQTLLFRHGIISDLNSS